MELLFVHAMRRGLARDPAAEQQFFRSCLGPVHRAKNSACKRNEMLPVRTKKRVSFSSYEHHWRFSLIRQIERDDFSSCSFEAASGENLRSKSDSWERAMIATSSIALRGLQKQTTRKSSPERFLQLRCDLLQCLIQYNVRETECAQPKSKERETPIWGPPRAIFRVVGVVQAFKCTKSNPAYVCSQRSSLDPIRLA